MHTKEQAGCMVHVQVHACECIRHGTQVHGERHEAAVGVTFALLHALLLQVYLRPILRATYCLLPTYSYVLRTYLCCYY